MSLSNFKIYIVAVMTAALGSLVTAQQPVPKSSDECSIATYSAKEVDHRVRILAKPEPAYAKQDRRKHWPGVIVLSAVFCGSGEVTGVKVKSGMSDGLNEKAIEAARKIRFIPAEKDGQKVSQVLILKYVVSP
jgi:TonB family protein